jgi:hypothetical protein
VWQVAVAYVKGSVESDVMTDNAGSMGGKIKYVKAARVCTRTMCF